MDELTRHNFRATYWQAVHKEMAVKLKRLETQEVVNQDEFHTWLRTLTEVIQKVIEMAVPKMRPSPYMKCWWSQELAQC